MEYIKKINVPMALLCLLSLRLMFTDSALSMALVAVGATCLYAYKQYLDTKIEKPINEEVKKDLEAIKNQMSNIAVKANIKPLPAQKFF
jgi:hypothetical protein